ncbi:MAG: hypothetical protein IPM29_14995 [Planctomycetes bacterium]|nr:hypothetical protein [Planctomycetota bacterium]
MFVEVIGETIHHVNVGDETKTVYLTPWFSIGADNAIFTYERVHSTLPVAESVTVLTKQREDGGYGSTAATFSTTPLTSTQLYEANATGLQDLVRFMISLSGDTAGLLHYRFLPPTWYTTAV